LRGEEGRHSRKAGERTERITQTDKGRKMHVTGQMRERKNREREGGRESICSELRSLSIDFLS